MNNLIITSLKLISPQAAEFVKQNGCEILWSGLIEGYQSSVVQTGLDKMHLVYASLPSLPALEARDILKGALQSQILARGHTEKCFNCRGDDMPSRELAISLGYRLEMAGYQLSRTKAVEELSGSLVLQPYAENDLEAWIILLKAAYRQLCLENSWDLDCGTRNKEKFGQLMLQRSLSHEVFSCFHEGKLVGGFRLSGAYIEDMAVLPEFQNRGIGTHLLLSATKMLHHKGFPEVQLRVAESNQAALRLYQRNSFIICGRFAEHYYPC